MRYLDLRRLTTPHGLGSDTEFNFEYGFQQKRTQEFVWGGVQNYYICSLIIIIV